MFSEVAFPDNMPHFVQEFQQWQATVLYKWLIFDKIDQIVLQNTQIKTNINYNNTLISKYSISLQLFSNLSTTLWWCHCYSVTSLQDFASPAPLKMKIFIVQHFNEIIVVFPVTCIRSGTQPCELHAARSMTNFI